MNGLAGRRAARSRVQIPGHIDDDDVVVAADEQQSFEHGGPLVVQEMVLPAARDEFRNQHGNLPIGMRPLHLEDVVEKRIEHVAVRGDHFDQAG